MPWVCTPKYVIEFLYTKVDLSAKGIPNKKIILSILSKICQKLFSTSWTLFVLIRIPEAGIRERIRVRFWNYFYLSVRYAGQHNTTVKNTCILSLYY